MNTTNVNEMATSRQLFALWLAGGKAHDYRNDNLTKEQASELLDQFNKKSGYKSAKKMSEKNEQAKKGLAEELEDYLVAHFDEFFESVTKSMKMKSVVEVESRGETHRYAFIGCGCSISWFTYRKNNKKAEELAETARKLMRGKIERMFVNKFTKEEQAYYRSIGCPLEAIYSQDYGINSKLYSLVVRFAKEKGINMDYETRLD